MSQKEKRTPPTPTISRVFPDGSMIVGMREGFADRALESRFLTYETGGRPLRSDISIGLPVQAPK